MSSINVRLDRDDALMMSKILQKESNRWKNDKSAVMREALSHYYHLRIKENWKP